MRAKPDTMTYKVVRYILYIVNIVIRCCFCFVLLNLNGSSSFGRFLGAYFNRKMWLSVILNFVFVPLNIICAVLAMKEIRHHVFHVQLGVTISHTHTHTPTHTHIHTHTTTQPHNHTHTHTHTYTHNYTTTHSNTHTHARACMHKVTTYHVKVQGGQLLVLPFSFTTT